MAWRLRHPANPKLLPNDSGFLLQDHNADPEREPPGECCRTARPTLSAANPC